MAKYDKRKNNPFTLTFGRQPDLYISRYEDQEMIINTFSADHPVSQTYLIEGIRGSGKTVLMTSVANTLEQDGSWIVVNLNAATDLLTDMAMRLADHCHKMPDLMKKGFQVSLAGWGVGVSGDAAAPLDPAGTVRELLKQIKKKGKRVLITIDEVRHDDSMRVFSSQYQILIREEYPVFLLMTGLYESIRAIQNDPALTFLLRTPKCKLGALSLFQITKRYQEVFGLEDKAAKEMASLTKGYAFAFQALGVVYWENGDTAPMDRVLGLLDEMLDDFVYRKIWSSLTEKEREILHAMGDEETSVKDIYTKISMQPNVFSGYRDKLIRKGILISSKHGYVMTALPRFGRITETYD